MNVRNIIQAAAIFLREVRGEAKKVNWPTKQETIASTMIVIAVSVALALFLWSFDRISQTVVNRLILHL